jgi:hypothetical protein
MLRLVGHGGMVPVRLSAALGEACLEGDSQSLRVCRSGLAEGYSSSLRRVVERFQSTYTALPPRIEGTCHVFQAISE